MGIDAAFFDRMVSVGGEGRIFAGSTVAILGDCRFLTPWATGDNARDLEQFRERLGIARVETLDIGGNPTIRLDLHEPVPEHLLGRFDIVIDAGTAHCCFDVARVLQNCLSLMKERATMFHLSAMTGYMGRCYYSFNPLLFKDFYEQNGFEALACEYRVVRTEFVAARWLRRWRRLLGMSVSGSGPIPLDGPYLQRADYLRMDFGADSSGTAHMLPNDAVIFFAAQRAASRPFVRPVPSFFTQAAAAEPKRAA